MRHRRWAFTFNNYPKSFLRKIKSKLLKKKYTYLVMGQEIGKEGTKHLQCYIEMKEGVDMAFMKKNFHKKIHWEGAKYGAKCNVNYCKKDGIFYEWGTPKRQGIRNDITKMIECIEDGNGIRNMCRGGMIKSMKSFATAERLLKYFEPPRKRGFKPKIIWVYGPAGSGKNKWVDENYPDHYRPVRNDNGSFKWWEGYDGDEVVLFDEYRAPYEQGISWFLEITDRYGNVRVEHKGGSRMMTSKVLIFTAQKSPLKTFEKFYGEDLKQITRRITLIKNMACEN